MSLDRHSLSSEANRSGGHGQPPARARAEEVRNLLNAVQDLLVPFISSADRNVADDRQVIDGNGFCSSLVEYKRPEELQEILQLELPSSGQGQDGLIRALRQILRFSVNTWHQGFLDKLYASTNAPGVAAELILATLNTNVHVYQVSPALTVIEKFVGKQLAALFGLKGPHAGGISVQGGSASNMTSIVIARNTLHPSTKTDGYEGRKFVLFTSLHGHYSVEKAAQMLGFGSGAAWPVPVDKDGRMIPSELENLIQRAKDKGRTPFYVNATAGTTVFGSFDPFHEISAICQKHGLWFHVDGSWGGSFVFSEKQRHKISGAEKANSISINPHKMLGVPITCSFLLGADIRQFHSSNTTPAGYLFHDCSGPSKESVNQLDPQVDSPEVWDLADLTLQCGRRADSLKLFLGWTYYGSEGYQQQIDSACDVASYLADLISSSSNFILISENPPPCLQVCFYYAPGRRFVYERENPSDGVKRGAQNSRITEEVTRAILRKGFMVDFAAPICDEQAVGQGKFFRCVVNILTKTETIEALVHAIEEVGPGIIKQLKSTSGRK
ncbi:Pyridoxal phosphate-dependent transferase [Elaphomyces granulatus]